MNLPVRSRLRTVVSCLLPLDPLGLEWALPSPVTERLGLRRGRLGSGEGPSLAGGSVMGEVARAGREPRGHMLDAHVW